MLCQPLGVSTPGEQRGWPQRGISVPPPDQEHLCSLCQNIPPESWLSALSPYGQESLWQLQKEQSRTHSLGTWLQAEAGFPGRKGSLLSASEKV